MSSASSPLFAPLNVGDMKLAHRVVMAPMTRLRADSSYVIGDATVEYYRQRSAVPGTFVITEFVTISSEAGGFPNMPGAYTDAQIAAWKKVVDAVHANGSYIFLQIGSLGRVGYPSILHAEGHPYVSSSPVPLAGRDETPVEMSESDIKRYVENYAKVAHAAVHVAGFDGVEIHACNGGLAEQFIQDTVNKRTDKYGGSIENRARYLFEVTEAVSQAVGDKRIGVRFSPWSKGQGMGMVDPIPTYSHIISGLAKGHPELAYIHMIEPGIESSATVPVDIQADGKMPSNDFAYELWSPRPYLTAGGYTAESAKEAAEKRDNVAVVMGRPFIANPDLPYRILHNLELAASDNSTWYTTGTEATKGYIDYPSAVSAQA
ncbi:NADH:flavin oxidoreductase/NADH oxidase [Ceratobasidium sp. AG-Ba]|nr:NADH:flavin oxidoreductase/NADH oxidase [Ceratobasidium sp. AG-Ba]